RIKCAMWGASNPRCSSQSRKPSPASGAQSVPSQSNTATPGLSRSTESRNLPACSGMLETGIIFGSIHVEGGVRVVHWNINDVALVLVLNVAGVGGDGRAQKSFHHLPSD